MFSVEKRAWTPMEWNDSNEQHMDTHGKRFYVRRVRQAVEVICDDLFAFVFN